MSLCGRMVHQEFRNDYIVYEVVYKGEIVYIGSGKWGRQFHAVSGVSHNYDLNKIHFSDQENIEVNVVSEGLTKEESLAEELKFIQDVQPIFNKIGVKTSEKRRISRLLKNISIRRVGRSKFKSVAACLEFLGMFYSIEQLCGGFPIKTSKMVRTFVQDELRNRLPEHFSIFESIVMGKVCNIFEQFEVDGVVYSKVKKEYHATLECSEPEMCLHALHVEMYRPQIVERLNGSTRRWNTSL